MLTLFFFIVFLACVGCLYTEGMWNNAIRLINVITAALLAMNFWEPVAHWLTTKMPSFTYFWDFLALWGLFVLFAGGSRLVTDYASRVKVRFLGLVDRLGSAFFAAWIGWVMVCFTATTLHTAPLSERPFGGAFHAEQRAQSGTSPEILWLGFTQRLSWGAFCRSATAVEWETEKYVFDPKGEFIPKYRARRLNLEYHVQKTDTFRILPEQFNMHY
jgi:hypothetical protein